MLAISHIYSINFRMLHIKEHVIHVQNNSMGTLLYTVACTPSCTFTQFGHFCYFCYFCLISTCRMKKYVLQMINSRVPLSHTHTLSQMFQTFWAISAVFCQSQQTEGLQVALCRSWKEGCLDIVFLKLSYKNVVNLFISFSVKETVVYFFLILP